MDKKFKVIHFKSQKEINEDRLKEIKRKKEKLRRRLEMIRMKYSGK